MDTLTHALSGALVARLITARVGAAAPAVLPRESAGRFADAWRPGGVAPWQGVVVGLVAGAFPDVDVVAQLFGDVAYLTQHRGVTHSLPLMPLWAAGVAWLMAWCFAATRGQRVGWRPLWAFAAGGITVHIAGDWITQFGTMLLAPFSDRRFGLGAMFIIDLTFSGLLLAGLLLAALWPARRWPAALGLGAAVGWVMLATLGQQEAVDAGERWAQQRGIADPQVTVMPRPASPFNWTVTVFDGRDYFVAHVNTRRTEPLAAGPDANFVRRFSAPYLPVAQAAWTRVPRFGGPGTPAWVQDAWRHPDFAFYRWFAQTPALFEARSDAAGRCAWFRDLRFDFPGRGETPFLYALCLPASGDAPARVLRMQDGQALPV